MLLSMCEKLGWHRIDVLFYCYYMYNVFFLVTKECFWLTLLLYVALSFVYPHGLAVCVMYKASHFV